MRYQRHLNQGDRTYPGIRAIVKLAVLPLSVVTGLKSFPDPRDSRRRLSR